MPRYRLAADHWQSKHAEQPSVNCSVGIPSAACIYARADVIPVPPFPRLTFSTTFSLPRSGLILRPRYSNSMWMSGVTLPKPRYFVLMALSSAGKPLNESACRGACA